MFGMPYMSNPPGRSARSKTVTRCPALFNCAAAEIPAGPEPMTATVLPVRFLRRFGFDPAVFPAVVNDFALDVLDRDGRIVDSQNARAFARRGTDASGEFGKIIRLVQAFERFLPQAAINQIIPFGNQIMNRTTAGHAADELAGVAERNPAIHAARALLLEVGFRQVMMKFLPVGDASNWRTVFRQFAFEILKIRLIVPSVLIWVLTIKF